jgi:putative membrane protein
MTRDFITNEFSSNKLTDDELKNIHKKIVHRHVAWLNALTYQLREPRDWEHYDDKLDMMRKMADIHHEDNHHEKLIDYLSKEDYDYIMTKGNKASHLISLQSKDFKRLKQDGLIDDFRHMELKNILQEFYTLQGKSERIKNFPFPRQYASVNYFFVWIFIFMIPFAMLNIFSETTNPYYIWATIPIAMLVSWVFIMMEMIGDYSENPFEGLYNDVPIKTLARGIEIDIRQMLDETDLPKNIEPFGEFKVQL